MERRNRAGLTLVELAVVLAIIAAVLASATFGINAWSADQRVKSAARSVSDAFMLARAEAIRTGDNHIAVFGLNALSNVDADIVIANDDTPGDADCSIDTSEIVHRVTLERGVAWGTTSTLADTTAAPGDQGLAVDNVPNGSSFTTAALDPNVPARWVLFQPDGIPLLFTTDGSSCTEIGFRGQAGGAIYVTNGRRDYAIVLSPLGTSRVHAWNPGTESWTD